MQIGDGDVRVEPGEHVVHLFERDEQLAACAGEYAGEALGGGDPVLLVLTSAHRDGIERALTAAGVDLQSARLAGRYVVVDAERLLRRLVVAGGSPDPERFEQVVGGLVHSLAAEGRLPRVLDEMGSVLLEGGSVAAALALERLWADLGRSAPLTLCCAYPDRTVAARRVRQQLRRAHTDLLPERACEPWCPDRVTRRFEAVPSAARAARHLVVEALEDWGCEHLVDSTALVVGELVGNAIRHGGRRFSVTVSAHPDALRVAVSDPSSTTPAVRPTGEHAVDGRGLHLVEALSRRWGTDVHDRGKTVWAEMDPRACA